MPRRNTTAARIKMPRRVFKDATPVPIPTGPTPYHPYPFGTMKKFLAIAACAALLTGCDFVGGASGDAVAVASLTINAMPAANDLYVEVQDAGGRAVPGMRSTADDFSGAFPYTVSGVSGEITGTTRSYFLVLMNEEADGTKSLIAASPAFSADDLRAVASDSASTFRVQSGEVDAELTLAQ